MNMKIVSFWKSVPSSPSMPYQYGEFIIRAKQWLLDFFVGASFSSRDDFQLDFSITYSPKANADMYFSVIVTAWWFSAWFGIGPSILWRDPKAQRVTTTDLWPEHDFASPPPYDKYAEYVYASAYKYTAPDSATDYIIVVAPIHNIVECWSQIVGKGWEYLTLDQVKTIRDEHNNPEDGGENRYDPFTTVRYKDWVKYLL